MVLQTGIDDAWLHWTSGVKRQVFRLTSTVIGPSEDRIDMFVLLISFSILSAR
jgi:hypothetical protein